MTEAPCLYVVTHTHRHGSSMYHFWAKEKPAVEHVLKALDIDYEPDLYEEIEVDLVEIDALPCLEGAQIVPQFKRLEKPVTVAVGIDGGIVQGATATAPVNLLVVDRDCGMDDAVEYEGEIAWRYEIPVAVDSDDQWLQDTLKAMEADNA